jgi:ankyrin repeat protein
LAISSKRIEIVKYLLGIGVDYAIRNSVNNKTSLDYAIESGDLELVKFIVNKIIKDKGIKFTIKKKINGVKVFVDRTDIPYQTQQLSKKTNKLDILCNTKYIVPENCGIILVPKDKIKNTINDASISFNFAESFIRAIKIGNLEIIDYLLNINLDLAESIFREKKEKITTRFIKESILICLENKKIDIIVTILKYIKVKNIKFDNQNTIFHLLLSAIYCDDEIDYIMELITSNQNMVTYKNMDGDTILHLAAKNRQTKLYNKLLEIGMDENDTNHMLETPKSIIQKNRPF